MLLIALAIARPAAAANYGYSTTGANLGTSERFAFCTLPDTSIRLDKAPCPKVDLHFSSRFNSSYFNRFVQRVLVPGRGYIRLWIPYDALGSWRRGAGCVQSPFRTSYFGVAGSNGQQWFNQLVWGMQAAWHLGLNVDIELSAGSGEGAPQFPDPFAGNARYYNAWETAGGRDYDCGVRALMAQVSSVRSALGQQSRPVQWEAFNEPDLLDQRHADGGGYVGALGATSRWPHGPCGRRYIGHELNDCGGEIVTGSSGQNYLCGSDVSSCGALEAAELWEQAEIQAKRFPNYKVAALTASAPQSAYALQYLRQLNALHLCAVRMLRRCYRSDYPRWWAIHDYDDPTAAGEFGATAADLKAFEEMLSANALRRAQVWVTESGVDLASRRTADDNWAEVHCRSRDPADGNDNFGCLVDADPPAQARGAAAWRALGRVRAPRAVTSEVYWFEFTAIGGWDSALLDHGSGHGLLFESQGYGSPRASFCYLTGATGCNGNPDEWLGRTSEAVEP